MSAGTQEDARARVEAWASSLEEQADAMRNGADQASRALDLRAVLSALTKAEQERDEAVKRAEGWKADFHRSCETREEADRVRRNAERTIIELNVTAKAAEARAAAMEGALKMVAVYEIDGQAGLHVSINGAEFYVLTRLEAPVRQFDAIQRAALAQPGTGGAR